MQLGPHSSGKLISWLNMHNSRWDFWIFYCQEKIETELQKKNCHLKNICLSPQWKFFHIYYVFKQLNPSISRKADAHKAALVNIPENASLCVFITLQLHFWMQQESLNHIQSHFQNIDQPQVKFYLWTKILSLEFEHLAEL